VAFLKFLKGPAVRAGFFLTVAGVPSGAWDLYLSLSQAYTTYDAADLNRVLVLLEKTTQQQGFNNYQVSQFDGHPQNALIVGFRQGAWRYAVEAEFWVEEFAQYEVPYDLRQAQRADRITCAEIRQTPDLGEGLYGCVEAHERFNFLPVTFQVSRSFALGSRFRAAPGYALGVLAGSAHIELATSYYGEGAAENDRIRFQVWPGVNPVHKLFADLEWLPWKRLGIEARLGWRYTRMEWVSLENSEGSSRIFSVVFPYAREGARLYIQKTGRAEDDQIFLGTPEDARAVAQSTGTRVEEAVGDFTGWFGALKVNVYLWGRP
jgi:hypothetical protein